MTVTTDSNNNIAEDNPSASAQTNNTATIYADSTNTNLSRLSFDQQYTGTLATPYDLDRWTFSAAAEQQVQLNLIAVSNPTVEFSLTGPGGYVAFDDLKASSGPITLPRSGSYTLAVDALGGQAGSYAFRVDQTALASLTIGTTYQGTLAGSGEPQLFSIDVPQSQSLLVELDDSTSADQDELYMKLGALPTRSDYQYRFTNLASPYQQILVPSAAAGTWYALLYAASVPSPTTYTILATAGSIFLRSSTPGKSSTSASTVLTLQGSGFDQTTTVDLVGADGTLYPATSTSIDLPTQITATFAAGEVPAGTYGVETGKPGIQPDILAQGVDRRSGGSRGPPGQRHRPESDRLSHPVRRSTCNTVTSAAPPCRRRCSSWMRIRRSTSPRRMP